MNNTTEYLKEYEILKPYELTYNERGGCRVVMRLNKEEKKQMEKASKILGCNMKSTTIKQLAKIGYHYLMRPETLQAIIWRNRNLHLKELNKDILARAQLSEINKELKI